MWHQTDGLQQGEACPKSITFKNGFVRVRKSDWVTITDEGWASETEKTFDVPPWHCCEVLDCASIFFKKSEVK